METKSERLSLAFSEGGAQEIYQEIKSNGDFLGFAQRYAFDSDYRVARSALWGLTKAKGNELSELQAILNELIDQAIQSENSSVRRLTLNIIRGGTAKLLKDSYELIISLHGVRVNAPNLHDFAAYGSHCVEVAGGRHIGLDVVAFFIDATTGADCDDVAVSGKPEAKLGHHFKCYVYV